MRVAIVIPAFNVAPFVGQAIGSVLAQTHPDWVLTVVDDGSADDTAAAAAQAIGGDPRCHLIRRSNAGVSAARNAGISAHAADATLFLDADDWLAPNALSVLMATLDRAPDAIAAVGAWRRVPAREATRIPPSGDLLSRLLVRNLFVNGGHVLIRNTTLAANGLFDTTLRFGEDWEYWVRLACLGPFAAHRSREPLLFVRERIDGAYVGMAGKRDSFAPCLEAIFTGSMVRSRLNPPALTRLRHLAEAEADWICGRELVRHDRPREGWPLLLRSVRAAPRAKRLAMLALAAMPFDGPGPFRRYRTPGFETICNK